MSCPCNAGRCKVRYRGAAFVDAEASRAAVATCTLVGAASEDTCAETIIDDVWHDHDELARALHLDLEAEEAAEADDFPWDHLTVHRCKLRGPAE